MKLIHLSDLHLGKRVNEFSMIEDQEYILTKIINIIDEEKPDGVMIAGDVYDRSVPSEEAMQLWDDFLLKLASRRIEVYAISGNHDSAVRFSDHNTLVEASGIHLSPVYDGNVKKYTRTDEFGNVNIYLLPFIKPVSVKNVFPDEEINDYTDACRVAIEHMNINEQERNILIAHQFVTGATRCESEEVSVGGLDNVNASVFDQFDYVALGHIHGKQNVGTNTIRYCGTPLKYSFSEKDHIKSVTVIEIKDKNELEIREVELVPRRDLREIRGEFDVVTSKEFVEKQNTEDYVQVVLTDENDISNAMGKLRSIYPYIMKLSYDNTRTRTNNLEILEGASDDKSELELFEEFYETQNGQAMSDEQRELVSKLIESIWG